MDNGWTKVYTKSRRRQTAKTTHAKSLEEDPSQTPSPRTTGPFKTLEAIIQDHESLKAQWEASPSQKSLCDIINKQFTSSPTLLKTCTDAITTTAANLADNTTLRPETDSPPITQAICLGLGTFDPSNGSWQAKRSTHLQLLAFETFVSQLQSLSPNVTITKIVQEPILTPNDVAFLKFLKYTVVASPEAFSLVNSQTLLFGVHLYRPIYAAALEHSLPGIFVGTGAEVWDTLTMEPTNDTSRLKEISEKYTHHVFPEEKDGTIFSNTSIFFQPLKKEQDESDMSNSEMSKAIKSDDNDTTTQINTALDKQPKSQ